MHAALYGCPTSLCSKYARSFRVVRLLGGTSLVAVDVGIYVCTPDDNLSHHRLKWYPQWVQGLHKYSRNFHRTGYLNT